MPTFIAQTIKANLAGTTVEEQCKANKARTDAVRQNADKLDDVTVKLAAASLHPGAPVDVGAKRIDEMKIAAKALAVTTKGRTTKYSQAQVDAEAGYPSAQGPAAVAAVMRLNRKGAS